MERLWHGERRQQRSPPTCDQGSIMMVDQFHAPTPAW